MFARPVKLAEAMMTDDAIFTAVKNRTDPLWAVSSKLEAYPGQTGDRILTKANQNITCPRSVIASIHKTLVMHEIAIGQVEWLPNDEGTHVGARLKSWPLEHISWNQTLQILETKTDDGEKVPIIHGNGEWIIFRRIEDKPWTQAAILPAAMIYAGHTTGLADWAGSARSHGIAKVLGEIPEGTSLMDEAGNLSPQAQSLLDTLVAIVSGQAEAGVLPPGMKADFIANQSSAWQIFSELILNREKAAHRVFTGTDAALGSQGGAPGVDISTLFGVATTKLQGDFEAIEEGINSGLIAPWAAINFGDSTHAPKLRYQLPDPDAEAKSKEEGDRVERLTTTMSNLKAQGFEIDQNVVDDLCVRFGTRQLKLSDAGVERVPLELAPTDVARIARVREARASQGLAPLGDARDDMFVSELEAAAKADAASAAAPPTTPAPVTE
jgi:hypothetical protein